MSSPAVGSLAYNNESVAWKLMTTDLVTVTIAFLLVTGRLYTKYFVTRSPGWEDCVYRYDLGRHSTIVPESDLQPLTVLSAVDGLLYVVSITLGKFAILIFLYRIFKVIPKFRYLSWAVGTIMTIWATVTVLLVCFSCKPLAASFNYKLRFAPTTVCKPESYDVENIFGFCNIFVDFMLLLMPMPLLWTLHLTSAKKVGVSVIFANGAVIAAIAIVRQYMLYTSPDAADPSWDIVQIKIWMIIEVNLTIVCGCLPVLQPLFRKIPLLVPFLPSHLRSNFSGGHSAMEQSSWPKKVSGPRHAGEDVERGVGGRKAPWREPDEMSESGSSVQSMYHHQQFPMMCSALEPTAVRTERLGGEGGGLTGIAL